LMTSFLDVPVKRLFPSLPLIVFTVVVMFAPY
jgi:hypothetical protein